MFLKRAVFLFMSLRGRRPKQSSWIIGIASLALAMTTAHAQVTKLDPLIHYLAKEDIVHSPSSLPSRQAGIVQGPAKALSYNEDGRLQIDCFVQIYNPTKAQEIARQIEIVGGKVRSIIENVMTAYLPVDRVEEISGWPEVKYIEAGKPMSGKMNVARVTTKVDKVNAGTDLDKRYDGSGVIVGIVDDTRPDFGNADFTDPAGKTRVKFYWDKNATGSGVAEIASSSGLECSKTQIDAATCTATAGGDTSSHSTHVAGIAAGDDATYKGVAPGADLIFVFNVETDANSGGNLGTTIVDDVRYVFAKADALNQPAVVNLSLGTSLGAHDNTSAMETSLNNLVSNHPGRAIVNAAGNENFSTADSGAGTYSGIHATVSQTGSDRAFDFAVRSGSSLASLGRQVIVDIWLNSTSTCTVELDAFDFAKTAVSINMGAVSAGSSGTATNSAGTTLAVNFTDSTNANNSKRHAIGTVTFTSAVSNAAMQAFSFDLIFRGTCTGDAWLWPDRTATNSFTQRFGGTTQGQAYTYVNGDSNRTITIPGTASNLITVASFMSRGTWIDTTGTTHNQTATSGTDFTSLGATGGTVNAISLFSSLGPTPDGRTKPDIAAPGEAIVSSLSASNSVSTAKKVDSNHFKLEGTSMASPHVAGIVALMFQKNPCLTSNQVKTLITGNAATDSSTGTTGLPNNTWGYGKVDALEIMKDITTLSGTTCGLTGSTGQQETPVTTTSGTAGGGGCMGIGGEGQRTTDHGLRTFLGWGIFCLILFSLRGTKFRNNF